MALISPDSVERVKQAADIVEVVSAHTDLRRQGARYVGLCPFHDERTPSFSVEPTEKLYHCFGCGVGGDVIKFIEEKDGLNFAEAVELLADRYGVELEREQEDPRAEAKAPAAAPPGGAAGTGGRLLLQLPLGVRGGGEGTRLPGASAAWAKRCCATSASATRRAPGTSSWSADSGPASASRSCAASASSSAAAAAASTTASASGSCSRSATAAAASSASAAGRCAPTRVPSTSTPPRPSSSTRARSSTASTGPKRRSPKPGELSSSRATPTSWRCTRPGSRRRWR